jgi:hypothetical protein
MRSVSLAGLLLLLTLSAWSTSISIQGDSAVLEQTAVRAAIDDFKGLLEKHSPAQFTKIKDAEVVISLIPADSFSSAIIPSKERTKSTFKWNAKQDSGLVHLQLSANSHKAFADGLYALLQERLGFSFYHPNEFQAPDGRDIDWKTIPSFSGNLIFETAGFHLHTMHPLELTESLLDENAPDAFKNVQLYIDWLARNGQNYFEFYLLESINRSTWIKHAKRITDYAHSRGIQCGVELSLHMIQQKAFKLYSGKLNKPEKIKKNIDWLVPAGFDVWNVELSTHEFSQGDAKEKKTLLKVLAEALQHHSIKLMSRAHVVQPEKMVSGNKEAAYESVLADQHGVMIHTVMFYTLNDTAAPVYENKNLLHMRDMLHEEQQRRETWYYPESAYWVTFDNSVPMLLLPYLSARLDDINYCMNQQVTGHVTFSSGWEWGYWLIDWSIARWSWNYTADGRQSQKYPLQYMETISANHAFKAYLQKTAELQQQKIKQEELIRVLTAQTVTDEIPGKFNSAYHPRPEFSYKHIRNKADKAELDFMKTKYLQNLTDFMRVYENAVLPDSLTDNLTRAELEVFDALHITYLRAKHRFNTLSYLIEFRTSKLTKTKTEYAHFLEEAEKIRHEALDIVSRREAQYRYPVESIALKRKDHTAYHFGYLFPVHELHFWEREALQAEKNKYRFLYKNIWSVARIIGLIN